MLGDERHNIVIIGAGIIGCCTAYYITRHPSFSLKNHTLTILEASSPASGASGKAGGLISLDWHRGPTVSLAQLSFAEHSKLAAEHNGKDKWEYRRLNVYAVEASGSAKSGRGRHISNDLNWLDQKGLNVEEASKDGTVDDVWPMAQVHPFKFTTSILALAEESGAKLVQGRATSLNSNSISYKAEDNANPVDIPADTIIVTAGPWTPTLLPQVQISTSRAHSIVIEPKNQLPAQAIFFSYSSPTYRHAISPELYSRPSSVYICGPTDSRHALPEYAKDVQTLEKQTSQLEQFAKEISTDLEEGKVVVRQACYLPFHERGFPAVGWSSAPRTGKAGVFVAAGHAVWGISLAPGTGKVGAEMVMGGNQGKSEGWDVRKLAP